MVPSGVAAARPRLGGTSRHTKVRLVAPTPALIRSATQRAGPYPLALHGTGPVETTAERGYKPHGIDGRQRTWTDAHRDRSRRHASPARQYGEAAGRSRRAPVLPCVQAWRPSIPTRRRHEVPLPEPLTHPGHVPGARSGRRRGRDIRPRACPLVGFRASVPVRSAFPIFVHGRLPNATGSV